MTTRDELVDKTLSTLDDYAEREIERCLARHGHDPVLEAELRHDLAQWREKTRLKVEEFLREFAGPTLH
jgi:hypothetical protein